MKKLHVSAISILFAVLCLVFTACNQGIIAGNETGTVQVVIGGGARAVDAAGMPVFDEKNTTITVTGEDGTKLAEGRTSVTVEVGIGTKITVKAVVTTAAGTWRGSVEHTVTAGTNIVAVKLSKTPKNMGNILSSVISQASGGDAKVTFKLASGKELLNDVDIGSNHIIPVIARDGIGRIYVLYDKGGRHFTRFDAEGNEDTGFETAINAVLPSTTGIEAITVDAKTNRIFVVDGAKHVYAVTEKGHNNFTLSNGFGLASIGIDNTIQTAAAYNGTLFFTVRPSATSVAGMKNKLVAVKAELSGSSLTLSNKIEMELPKLRAASAFGNYLTNCTGLFADESGVYCLLKEQNLDSGTLYALGQLVRYQYSGSTLTEETKIGLHSKAGASDSSLAFEAGAFVNPIGFIGSDEDYIYIADDGYNIEYLNENWRINGNKNRIAAFNRKTNEITFTDTDATWYGQRSEYKFPNTKILLWERLSSGAFRYWTSASGTDSFTSGNKLFESSTTDTFCYDQDGNLYILWKDVSNYTVRRFELKEDGSYEKAAVQDLNLGTSGTVNAIAVDVSNGKNYLYYYTETPTPTGKKIERFKWEVSFNSGSKNTAYNISVPSTEKVTALAANKDGVFVATKEQSTSDVPYTLKIKKYTKDTGAPLEEKTIATHEGGDNPTSHSAINYTNSNGTVCGLQVIEGVLYALRHNIKKTMKYDAGATDHACDEFRSSGVLYKVGQTANTFTGSYDKEFKKEFIDPLPSDPTGTKGTGYGFYRFIAVKPKKLIIASDGAWGKDGTLVVSGNAKYQDTDKVLEYDLAGALQHERDSGGSFSKKLTTDASGFKWQ